MFSNPISNLKFLDLSHDMIVADLGAGTGFYTLNVAQLVPKGKVYAIDINKDFLKTIANTSLDKKIKNIEILHADLEHKEGSKLKDSLIDRVIISNILFMITNRKAFLKESNRILKEGGKVLFVDFDPNSSILKNTKHKTLTKDEARQIFEDASFVYERDFMTGDHHYGMIFTKPIKK
ncbi:MAG: methyltransferase domain-containing protein [Candidatus Pacebacteria bacterium]|nr:methyltransferase domain-containing protein [Candidatus Paceibacterota bacterium]